jgi:molecular chaperone DnaJ
MSTTKRCYYETLNVSREASPDDLRKAYKKEAMKHHPDRNPDNPESVVYFKEVNEAYQVLSDDNKRNIYDQFGHAGLEGGAGGFDGGIGDVFSHMQDLFSEMFAGGGGFGGQRVARRGADLRVQQRLTLKEAAFGTKREVVVNAPARCDDCGGSGAKAGTKPEACPHCRGSGQVSSARGFVMFTTPCQKCEGQGAIIRQPCKTCEGQGAVQRARKVNVQFPAGIDAGQRLRVPGQGMAGPPGTPSGDLYVELDVEEDARFERDGADLVTRAHVSFTEAALGAELRVPSLEDDSPLTVPIAAGTQSGTVIQVKGQGVPRLDGRGRGVLAVVVQVDVPTNLSARAREILSSLDAELRESAKTEIPAPPDSAGKKRVASAK